MKGTMFFNENYNFDGTTGSYSDGFIVQFCNDFPTFKNLNDGTEYEPTGTALHTVWTSPGELTLLGLADGPHSLRIYDAQGRLVLEQAVQSLAGRSTPVALRSTGTALYLLVVDGERTTRVVPIH